jgi:spermidine synthase
LDVVDINNQVVQASDFFVPWNNNVLSDPRTELIIQDGRAHIGLTNRTYDIVISEPSNPWMAGLATLFTADFFELVKKRLNPDGIFVEWIHAYQIDWENFALVGRTFAEVFPNSLLVGVELTGFSADYLLVGFNGENGLSVDNAKQNLSYAQKSKNMALLNHALFYNLIRSEDLEKLFGNGYINTDNHPRLEFTAPKLMHFYDRAIVENIVSKKWLSDETENIIRGFLSDIDAQIDIAVYFLAFDEPFQKIVDITYATPLQRERYLNLVSTYCASHYITDFSFIRDEELKEKCISTQIKFIRDKLNSVNEKAPLYFHLGDLCYENDMMDEAIDFYSKVLEIDSEVDVVHYNIGKIFSVKGNYEEAILHYQEAIRINPEYLLAINNLGNILVREGKIEEAIRHYRKALRIDNTFSLAHKNLGIVLREMGEKEEGEAHIQEALRLEQKSGTLK